ncbi:MAG: glycosyltransferase [Geminicoccaceae bacterium]
MMTTLLVATTGGHLVELFELAQRLPELPGKRMWVTFDTPQSRSLLKDEAHVVTIPEISERDVLGVVRGFVTHARRIFREERIGTVISTGSAIALSFLPYAALRGVDTHYIESATRFDAPSLTGRLLEKIPRIKLYHQYPHLRRGRWHYSGSVFDRFEVRETSSKPVKRAVVTVGSVRQSFHRLFKHVAALMPPDVEVLWQTGHTPVDDLPIKAEPYVESAVLDQAIRDADVVIAHGGCGSALGALNAGKFPILMPRDPNLGELVDGHQPALTRWLHEKGLALERSPESLSLDDLKTVATRQIARLAAPPPFPLVA